MKINVPQNMRLLREITYMHSYSAKLLKDYYMRLKLSFLSLKLSHLRLPKTLMQYFSILDSSILFVLTSYYVSSYSSYYYLKSSLRSGLDGFILIDYILLNGVFVILSHISWILRNYTLFPLLKVVLSVSGWPLSFTDEIVRY